MTVNPLSANFTKWSNTLKQFVGNLPTNCLSVFDHFVGLALKGLNVVLIYFSFLSITSDYLSHGGTIFFVRMFLFIVYRGYVHMGALIMVTKGGVQFISKEYTITLFSRKITVRFSFQKK